MDIRKFAVEETGVLKLLGANDEPLVGDDGQRMTVTVYGPGSKAYAAAQAVNQNRMVDKLKKRGPADQTAEQRAQEHAEFLASCTVAFSPNIEYDDLQGPALFKAVYSDQTIGFIAEQVGKFLNEWGNFTKPSTPQSASTSNKSLG